MTRRCGGGKIRLAGLLGLVLLNDDPRAAAAGGGSELPVNSGVQGLAKFQELFLASRVSSDLKFFQCLVSGEAIPLSALNDEYCDCVDGTDEPGTSACAGKISPFLRPEQITRVTKANLLKWVRHLKIEDKLEIARLEKQMLPNLPRSDEPRVKMILRSEKIIGVDDASSLDIHKDDDQKTSSWADLPPWGYFCRQEQHEAIFIPSWMVGDGICDCCDGGDEIAGACPNVCKSLGQELAAEAKAEREEEALVLKLRDVAEAEGQKLVDLWRSQAATLGAEIAEKEKAMEVEQAKEEERARIEEAEKQASLEKKVLETSSAPGVIMEGTADSSRKLSAEKEDEVKPPGAVISEYAKWMEKEAPAGDGAAEFIKKETATDSGDVKETATADGEAEGIEEDEEGDDDMAEIHEHVDDAEMQDDDEDAHFLDGDDQFEDGENHEIRRVNAPRDKSLKMAIKKAADLLNHFYDKLADAIEDLTTSISLSGLYSRLLKSSVSKPSAPIPAPQAHKASPVQKLRSEIATMRAELTKATEKVKINHVLDNPQFAVIADQTQRISQGGFSYEITPFKTAIQKDSSRSSVNIGTFKDFANISDLRQQKAVALIPPSAKYSGLVANKVMRFENGQKCGESDRQSHMYFVCAATRSLLAVEEPEPCRYSFVFGSELLCSKPGVSDRLATPSRSGEL